MAIVQISRIQVRRGQKNQGTGLPQLASGEIGWAIDTQELFIGNGSVAEGAPQVGNTKVVTEHDNLFVLADEYIYREGSGSIVTGIDSANPVKRSLQERLDDRVSVRAFGLTGLQSQDATVLLQRAIDQLFLNAGNELTISNRVKLYIEPGVYTVKDTIKIPPHATLIGAGEDKTIIRQTNPNRAVFQTVSDESVPGGYVVGGEYNTQARNIHLEGMTLLSTDRSKGLVLDSCRDSHFEHLKIIGNWNIGDIVPTESNTTTDVGLSLNSKNGGVETARNEFVHCVITNWGYGVVSNWDINDNTFDNCDFTKLGYGVAFGKNMTLDGNIANGTAIGPSNNAFNNCFFEDTAYQALFVAHGSGNISRNNNYYTCANNGGADDQPETAVITFNEISNKSIDDYFTRTRVLSYSQGTIRTSSATLVAGGLSVFVATTSDIKPGQLITKTSGVGEFGVSLIGGIRESARVDQVISPTEFTVTVPHDTSGFVAFELTSPIIEDVPYIPEVEGPSNIEWGFEHEVTVLDGDANTLFRLPKLVNQSFVVDYLALSEQGYTGLRSGKLHIVLNALTDGSVGTPAVSVSDEYDYVGDNVFLDAISFDAILSDVGATGDFNTIVVKSYASAMPTGARTKFKFKVQTKQSVL